MIKNITSSQNNKILLFQTSIFFTLLLGVFSLLHNLSFYMNQYFVMSSIEIESGRMALGLSLLLSLLGYQLSFVWGSARVIKLGALLSAFGLLAAADVSQSVPFIVSVVVFCSGLVFSIPALFLTVKKTWLAKKPYIALIYSMLVVLLAMVGSFIAVVNSYYGFKELCCALAVLSVTAGICLTSSRRMPILSNADVSA